MAKTQASPTTTVVRDSKSGRLVTLRGAGALKGQLTIERGIDLTKPIAAQVMREPKAANGSASRFKR